MYKFVFYFFTVLYANSVLACVCSDESLQEKIARAESIFSGRVVDAELTQKDGLKIVNYSFDVTDYFKGNDFQNARVLTEVLGHSCSKSLLVGRVYIVFTNKKNELWMCSGTDFFKRYEYEIDGASLNTLKHLRK